MFVRRLGKVPDVPMGYGPITGLSAVAFLGPTEIKLIFIFGKVNRNQVEKLRNCCRIDLFTTRKD